MNEFLLSEAMPEFAKELEAALHEDGQADLLAQVSQLKIVDRCRCGEYFCAMFYTAPRPAGAWGPGHENVALDVETGDVILDVLNREIVAVEVLYRDEVRDVVQRLLP